MQVPEARAAEHGIEQQVARHAAQRQRRRRRLVWWLSAALVVCLGFGIGGYVLWQQLDVPAATPIAKPKAKPEFVQLQAADFSKDAKAGSFTFTHNGEQVTMPYRVYAPADYAHHKYPLAVYLSGSGQIGTDNDKQTHSTFLTNLTQTYYQDYPAIILAPQFPIAEKYSKDPEVLQAYMDLIAQVQHDYNSNEQQLYLTGISMGADTTYGLLENYADNIAAAAVLSGGLEDPTKVANYAKVPLWIFQGAQDLTYVPERARAEVASLQALGSPVKYTEYPDVAHSIWNIAYSDPQLYDWLFAQHLPG